MNDLAEEAKARPPGPKCQVAALLDRLNLTSEGRARCEEWISGNSYTHAGIHRALLGEWGDLAPSLWSISNHRRGNCRCSKEK